MNSNEGAEMDEKRLAEIRARLEAANDEPTGWQEFDDHAREDVPFLLEQLEQAQSKLQGAHDSLREHVLMVKEAQGQCDQACAVVGEFQSEASGLRAKLAASEAACAEMRAALERGKKQAFLRVTDLHHAEECPDFDRIEVWHPTIRCCCSGDAWWPKREEAAVALHLAELALASAGRGWLSPEEAEQKFKELNDALEEVERLRKELERPRIPIWKTATGQSLLERNGYVSEEECARRCREVGEALEAEFMKRINEMGIDLDAIIDRVAKGKS